MGGIVPTLIARLLEVRFKATKLFFVRRRSWPGDVKLLHETQESFMWVGAHVALVWHVGLVVLAYNRSVAQWGMVKVLSTWISIALALTILLHLSTRCLQRFWLHRAGHQRWSACCLK